MNKKKLLIVVNVDWIFIAHRMPIAKKALEMGYEVIVAAKDTGKSEEITKNGFSFIPIKLSRSGVNPIKEFILILTLFKLYNQVKPDLIYQITMKPFIYGSLVARVLKLKTVNGISGLGYNFTKNRRGLIQKVMIKLMKWGFNKACNYLIFENKDDFQELKDLGILNASTKISIIKGVGVDLNYFKPAPKPINEKLIVLLPSRMLWDKGVKEFIDAALLLKEKYKGKAFFKLCGMIDPDNLEAIPENYLRIIEVKGYLKWFGHQEDMITTYKVADIVVLPSYREGMPTALIEACAAGKPIVTTDAIGCRDCVDDGENGYKVPVKNDVALAEAIEKLLLSSEDRIRMGENSRKKAENEFSLTNVVQKHMDIFNEMV